MKKTMLTIVALMFICMSSVAIADPTGGPFDITLIRPYNSDGGSGAVFIHVSDNSLCETSVFKIDLSYGGSREAYAAAITAFTTNKKISIEVVNSTGCNGWGTTIQSIFLNK